MSKQNLISWAVFIILLLVLVIIAIQKFETVAQEVRVAKARNLASGLTAVAAVNYTQKKFASKGVAILNCKDVLNITGNHHLPNNFHVSDKNLQPENISNCIITGPGIEGIQFSEIGIR